MVELLLDAWPGCLQQRGRDGSNALHLICVNIGLSDSTALDVNKLLVARDSNLVSAADDFGSLPLHYAVDKPIELVKFLIESYPESVWVSDEDLSVHRSCRLGRVEVVSHLLELYPESFEGGLLIHTTASGLSPDKAEIIKVLLTKDPECASVYYEGRLPLHAACQSEDLAAIRLLFNAYPDAIIARDRDGNRPVDLARDEWIHAPEAACHFSKISTPTPTWLKTRQS